MAFTQDQNLLNSINLDSLTQLQTFMSQLQPILLAESGFVQMDNPEFKAKEGQLNTQLRAAEDALRKAQDYSVSVNRPGVDMGTRNVAIERVHAAQSQLDNVKQQMTRLRQDMDPYTFEKTAERLQIEEEFKALQAQQMELTKAQLDRQQKAIRGEIPTSETLTKQLKDEFGKFKEAQARAGNIIVGDSLENAAGKGTAAIESLEAFRNASKQAKERELQAIIHGEAPIAFQGFNLTTGGMAPRAYATPQPVNYGGLSQMSLASHSPFQFNQQMDMQMELARMKMEHERGLASYGRTSGLMNIGANMFAQAGSSWMSKPTGTGAA